ncbi:MAG: GTP-binding protein, partial [Spirosomaceae bacterium]|nr:GTP-binding protein [Spirosomataceae bacterium]
MDILKIATAGSVDDGKSTLIGRLLYETKSITKDKIEALEAASKRKGLDFVDLSLLTDGLIAEREQGITIDVAHIYFNSPQRKYIIADTPGHFEYTRNMVTGASNAAVSVILVDARNGVSEQTKRHFYIASLLRVKEVIVAVNKMDLVDYDEAQFRQIQSDFVEKVGEASFAEQRITFIPLSSLFGENIVEVSAKMPWYKGQSLLQHLESIELDKVSHNSSELPARFAVQYVIRPKTEEFHDYRGYAGRLSSGTFSVGDTIQVHPSGQASVIKTIEKFGENLEHAKAGDSVTLTLETDIDVSRGNMITKATEAVEPQ